jgi:hypothetical protein
MHGRKVLRAARLHGPSVLLKQLLCYWVGLPPDMLFHADVKCTRR